MSSPLTASPGDGERSSAGDPGEAHAVTVPAFEAAEQVHCTRWLVAEAIASEPARSLALEPHLASLGVLPHAAVFAKLKCDGAPAETADGRLGAPLPLLAHPGSGLPVHVVGRFLLRRPERAALDESLRSMGAVMSILRQ